MLPYDTPPDGGGLYVIWLSDTHYYGGRTQCFKTRFQKHLRALQNGKHVNNHMQNTFNKYRVFRPTVLEVLPKGLRVDAEQEWLDANHGKKGCLNLATAAHGGGHSLETRKKMSRTRTGMTHSEETKKKCSDLKKEWHRNNPCPVKGSIWINKPGTGERKLIDPEDEWMYEIQGWVRGQAGPGFTGKHSEEARQRMRENSNRGWSWVRKGGANRLVPPKELRFYLDSGWERGMAGKRAWVNKGGVTKAIPPEELSAWEKQGWLPGRAVTFNHKKQARDRIGKASRGKRWVRKPGFKSKRVLPEEVTHYLDQGWFLGKKNP